MASQFPKSVVIDRIEAAKTRLADEIEQLQNRIFREEDAACDGVREAITEAATYIDALGDAIAAVLYDDNNPDRKRSDRNDAFHALVELLNKSFPHGHGLSTSSVNAIHPDATRRNRSQHLEIERREVLLKRADDRIALVKAYEGDGFSMTAIENLGLLEYMR